MLFCLNDLAKLTGYDPKTVKRRVGDLPFTSGEKGAMMYESVPALARVYAVEQSVDGQMSNSQAASLLNQAKIKDLELDGEIKRKERIPRAVVEAVNEEAITAVVGMLKKYLPNEVLTEVLSELRAVGSKLKERIG